MATPLGATALLKALRSEGVVVVEHAGWATHNRNAKGPWGPVSGVVIHHTAGRNSMALCWAGTDALPGPLCHTHLAKDGTATMLSAGRANHAGTFAQNAYNAVVDESSVHPRPDSAEPVDGNARFYGIEIENLGDGQDLYPAVQYEAAVRWAAAICRAHGWSSDSVIGHKEGTRRKVDPSFDMEVFRDAVAARLAHDPDWNPGEEDDMTVTQDDINRIATATANKLINGGGVLENNDVTRVAAAVAARLQPIEAAQSAMIDKLVTTVATLAANVGELDATAIIAELKASIESVTIHLDVPDA